MDMKKWIRFCSLFLAAVLTLSGTAFGNSYVMTYSFGGTPLIYQNNLDKTGGVVDTLSPSCFDLETDGTVTIHTLTTEFVQNLHSRDIRVTPFLSNHWVRDAGIACLQNIDAVTTTLAQAVTDYDLDGINVDIQNVTEAYRDAYTQFVQVLRQKLPNSIITVAVAANPNGWTTGWHGSYDYAALAANSDYLMIMAYDESYYASDPGPVASAAFTEGSIQYALRYTTPGKIVLGVPLFGRYWQDDVSIGGYGIAACDVESLMALYPDHTATYHTDSQSVEVRVTLTADYKLWGGNTLSPGTYTIWYENLDSLRYKMDLINSYGLKGIGSWALGQEDTGFWELCRVALNDLIFSDITGHWAESQIISVYERGWMLGYSGLFRPDEDLTRAEAATVLVKMLQLDSSAPGEDFSDTKNHWARNAIAVARANGLVAGIGNNQYGPDLSLSREELAVMLDNAAILSNAIDYSYNPFSDLTLADHPWSYYSIIKLYANGVISGYPDGTFRPLKSITRAEFAAMANQIAGYGMVLGNGIDTRNFSFYSADGYNEQAQSPR